MTRNKEWLRPGIALVAQRVVSLLVAFLIAFALTYVLIFLSGYNPFQVFWLSLSGGFGSRLRLGLSLNEATTLLFATLAYIVAFRSGVWNIGAEGQLFMGAVGAVVPGIFLAGLPPALHLTIVILSGLACGAAWGAIPGFLKARFGTNEIITSLLMNFIATWFVSYLVRFPLKNPNSFIAVSRKVAPSARLPELLHGTSLHAGLLLALLLTVVVWFIFRKTVLGYRLQSMGANPLTAVYGGIPVGRLTIVAMAMSGGLAGLAGTSQAVGVNYLLAEYISPAHYGFLAIPLVFITRLNPFGALVVSIFFGGMLTGSRVVQMNLGIDPTVITIFLSLIMISLMLDPFIEKRVAGLLGGGQSLQGGRRAVVDG